MSRVVLAILTFLSAVLAYALDVPLLYFASLGFGVFAVGLWLIHLRGRFEIVRPGKDAYRAAEQEDLNALGILDIRPKGDGDAGEVGELTVRPLVEPSEPEPPPDSPVPMSPPLQSASGETADYEPVLEAVESKPESASNGATQSVTPVDRSPAIPAALAPSADFQVAATAPDQDDRVVLPFLQSLCAILGANTVCLASAESGDRRFSVMAIVSTNAYARTSGHIRIPARFRGGFVGGVAVIPVGEKGIPIHDLNYYRAELAVREVAIATVPTQNPEREVILVADSTKEGQMRTAKVRQFMEEYADLARAIAVTQTVAGQELPRKGVRPRRDIIEEEMVRAREQNGPLGLAIVMHNLADDIAGDELPAIEASLKGRLESLTKKARVERFGDLMFGVLYPASVDEVETWAVRVHSKLAREKGLLEGGVSVGVAMLARRHADPDDLRSDAAAALQEAFESGVCTIVE
jgi:hypothetical protein